MAHGPDQARSFSVMPICDAHRKNICTTAMIKRRPIHGCNMRETWPPPSAIASQKSHGDQKAKPVKSK